jgi:hypothetical protein
MFLNAVTPIWVAEALMTALIYALSPANANEFTLSSVVSILGILSFCVSISAFPWLAAYRVSKLGGLRLTSLLGAVSISGINLITLAIAYVLTGNTLASFEGAVILILFFVAPIQLVFGWFGQWYARRHFAKQI